MRRPRPLSIECLEERITPSVFGVPWPDPAHLTLSFAPNRTDVLGSSSQLAAMLDAQMPTQVWETAILRAFQTWAVNTNINIGLVPDGGAPFGTPGAIQGDLRFGDIRIGTYPLASDAIATASPFDVLSSTWAGDVLLNRSITFGPGGYDLFSVMLHEAGHVLGLPDDSDPASPMDGAFQGVRTGLSADDIAALQALYGPRQPDAFDAAGGDDTPATAVSLQVKGDSVNADLTTLQDVDTYQFRTTGKTSAITIQLRAAGLSLLTARVTVLDSNLNVLATAAASSPLDNDVTIDLSQLSRSQTYYIRVENASDDVFGTGSYQLNLIPGSASSSSSQDIRLGRVVKDNGHTNDSAKSATNLMPQAHHPDGLFAYSYWASLSDPSDVDYYKFKAPQAGSGTASVMTVMVWATQSGGTEPVVDVFDHHGNPIAANVLISEGGSYTIQVLDPQPDTIYLVAVHTADANALSEAGDYFLGIDFDIPQITMQPIVADHVLTAQAPHDAGTLHVPDSELFHLALTVAPAGTPTTAAVGLTIFSPSGQVLESIAAAAGQTRTLTLYLTPGDYTFQATGATADGSAWPALSYSLFGLAASDPIGPELADSIVQPAVPPPTSTGSFSWQGGFYSFLAASDPPAPVRALLAIPQLNAIQTLVPSAGGDPPPVSSVVVPGSNSISFLSTVVPAALPMGGVANEVASLTAAVGGTVATANLPAGSAGGSAPGSLSVADALLVRSLIQSMAAVAGTSSLGWSSTAGAISASSADALSSAGYYSALARSERHGRLAFPVPDHGAGIGFDPGKQAVGWPVAGDLGRSVHGSRPQGRAAENPGSEGWAGAVEPGELAASDHLLLRPAGRKPPESKLASLEAKDERHFINLLPLSPYLFACLALLTYLGASWTAPLEDIDLRRRDGQT